MLRKSRISIGVVMLLTMGMVAASQIPATAQNDGVAEAKAEVKKLTKRPTSIPVTAPIKGTVPGDISLAWLECGIPDCAVLGGPLQEAADYFGWDMETITFGLTPEEVKAGWAQAVRAKPDAVVATGFPRVIFDTELAELAADDTKVIDGFVADEPGDGITATYNAVSTSEAIGVAAADWVVSELGSDANVLFVTSSTFPTLAVLTDGFEARYEELCSDCKQKTLDVPATSIGGDLPEQIVAELRSSPDINYVVVDEGNMLIGLPQAMEAAGLDVPVVGQYPSETTLEYLKDGSIVKAIIMTQQADAQWQAADVLARSLAGDSFEADQPASPIWILTPKTAGQLKEPFAVVKKYKKQYKKLWKDARG